MFSRFKSNNQNTTGARRRILRRLYLSRMQLTVFLLVVFGILVGYTFFLSGIFQLHTVKFAPDQLSCTAVEKIRELFPRGKNLLFINSDELSAIIRAKFPCLANVQIRKQYPDTLAVSLSERETVAFLKVGVVAPEPLNLETPEASDSSQSAQPKKETDEFVFDDSAFSRIFGVDRDGVLLIENPDYQDSIPTLYFQSEKELALNQILDRELILNSLGILNQLHDRGVSVLQVKITGDSLYILGDSKYIFLLKKDLNRQVISLQLILQKAKIDSVLVEKVDLRFDKPVVVYNRKK